MARIRRKLGPGDPNYRPASGIPAKGSWEQFKPGNEAALVHGAGSRTDRYVAPVAEVFLADLLTDPGCPELLTRSVMMPSVRAWARAEAQALLTYNWLETLAMDKRYVATKQGQATPFEIWTKADKHAANLRTQNGLTPVSAARIHKNMTSAGLDLAQLAAEFAAAEYGDDGDDD